jgi:putative ATP-dependent endonuclease of OLD family
MDFLDKKAGSVQTIITTHSPNLASKANLENAILMFDGKAYPLDTSQTALEKSDYRYLQRFLDVTKSNLFFARGVVIVEGDAENIILPILSDLMERSFSKHGVSIVKVGSVGLFRYARIFQRQDKTVIPVRVACIADRDIVPDQAIYALSDKRKKESDYPPDQIEARIQGLKKNDGGPVRTFISPKWTLEFDLAYSGFAFEMYAAILLAKKAKSKGFIPEEERQKVINEAEESYKTWKSNSLTPQEIAANIYQPLYEKEASKAETAQFFVEYMQEHPLTADCVRKKLPSYLVEAIEYVTEK